MPAQGLSSMGNANARVKAVFDLLDYNGRGQVGSGEIEEWILDEKFIDNPYFADSSSSEAIDNMFAEFSKQGGAITLETITQYFESSESPPLDQLCQALVPRTAERRQLALTKLNAAVGLSGEGVKAKSLCQWLKTGNDQLSPHLVQRCEDMVSELEMGEGIVDLLEFEMYFDPWALRDIRQKIQAVDRNKDHKPKPTKHWRFTVSTLSDADHGDGRGHLQTSSFNCWLCTNKFSMRNRSLCCPGCQGLFCVKCSPVLGVQGQPRARRCEGCHSQVSGRSLCVLDKRGAVKTSFKQRVFEVLPHKLLYFKPDNLLAPRGAIELGVDTTVRQMTEADKDYRDARCFAISNGKRQYILRAASAHHKLAVMMKLRQAQAGKVMTPQQAGSSVSPLKADSGRGGLPTAMPSFIAQQRAQMDQGTLTACPTAHREMGSLPAGRSDRRSVPPPVAKPGSPSARSEPMPAESVGNGNAQIVAGLENSQREERGVSESGGGEVYAQVVDSDAAHGKGLQDNYDSDSSSGPDVSGRGFNVAKAGHGIDAYWEEASEEEDEEAQEPQTPELADGTRVVHDDDAIILAVKKSDATLVQKLISEKAKVEGKDDNGATALLWAAREGQTEIVEILLAAGADIEAKNKFKKTALMYAARGCDLELLEILLENGADTNASGMQGDHALLVASKEGREENCKLLIQEGAMLEATDTHGATALIWAAKNGHVATARVLLAAGANIKAKNRYGKSALSYAYRDGNEELTALFT